MQLVKHIPKSIIKSRHINRGLKVQKSMEACKVYLNRLLNHSLSKEFRNYKNKTKIVKYT